MSLTKKDDNVIIKISSKPKAGMSVLFHRMVDMAYWKGKKVVVLNDKESETAVWCKPWRKNVSNKKI